MIGGIIVSHGKLAEELLNALTIILGEVLNIEAISIGRFCAKRARFEYPWSLL